MRQRYYATSLSILAVVLFLVSCASKMDEQSVLAHAKDIHEKVLTVDTHADTPSRLLREGWNIGEWHDPDDRSSGCIDLPRMKEGGLDAEFFAVFVGSSC